MPQDPRERDGGGNSFCVTQRCDCEGSCSLLPTYCAGLTRCYFLSWEEPIKPKSMVGVSAGSAGTKKKGRKVLFLLNSLTPLLQRVSLWRAGATGNGGLSAAAAPEQGKPPVSPTRMSARGQQGLCAGLVEISATGPSQESPRSSKQAGWPVPCSYWLMLARLGYSR